jgi:hypothetical protein
LISKHAEEAVKRIAICSGGPDNWLVFINEAIDAATAEKDAHLDLMVDEFTRISNIANAITGHESKREIEANASEIVALCQRAKETISKHAELEGALAIERPVPGPWPWPDVNKPGTSGQ